MNTSGGDLNSASDLSCNSGETFSEAQYTDTGSYGGMAQPTRLLENIMPQNFDCKNISRREWVQARKKCDRWVMQSGYQIRKEEIKPFYYNYLVNMAGTYAGGMFGLSMFKRFVSTDLKLVNRILPVLICGYAGLEVTRILTWKSLCTTSVGLDGYLGTKLRDILANEIRLGKVPATDYQNFVLPHQNLQGNQPPGMQKEFPQKPSSQQPQFTNNPQEYNNNQQPQFQNNQQHQFQNNQQHQFQNNQQTQFQSNQQAQFQNNQQAQFLNNLQPNAQPTQTAYYNDSLATTDVQYPKIDTSNLS